MADAGEFPFRGVIIWLTPEQGGRKTGPPVPCSAWPYYAVTAYVPPQTADTAWPHSSCGISMPARGGQMLKDAGWLLTHKAIS